MLHDLIVIAATSSYRSVVSICNWSPHAEILSFEIPTGLLCMIALEYKRKRLLLRVSWWQDCV